MNDESQLEPPNSELQGLFDAEAEFPEMPRSSHERVRDALGSAIAILPPFGGGGGSGPGGMEGIGDAAAGAGSAAGAAGAASAAAAGLGGAKAIAIAAAIYAAGIASGVGLQTALTDESAQATTPAAAPTAPIEEAIPEAPTVTPIEPPAIEVAEAAEPRPRVPNQPPAQAATPGARPSPAQRASRLDAERAVIDVARAAIAHGHVNSALAAVRRHQREFPRGELQEEREGLWVIALAKGERREEAERRAARFHRRFPRSALRRAVDLALAE